MTSAKTPAEHAADLRARATSLLTGDIPRAHTRAAIVAELATEILRSAVPALVGQLRAGALAQSYDAAVKRAGETDVVLGAEASMVPPEVRAVFVLLRAQIDRTAKWLAGDGTEHAMTAVRLEGEARGLISAADAIDPPTPADAPKQPLGSPVAPPAASMAGEGWVELPGHLYGRRGDAAGGTTPPFVLVTATPGGVMLALGGDDLVALGGLLSTASPMAPSAPTPASAPPAEPAPAGAPAEPPTGEQGDT